VIKALAKNTEQPIVLPLSNPTSRVEATPQDVLNWTDGKAIVATGSPFNPVDIHGETIEIAQCNNSYIFPGIGLGVLAVHAHRVTDNMLMTSSTALAECSPLAQGQSNQLLPKLSEIREVSKTIALAVAKQAIADGVALKIPDQAIVEAIEHNFWQPEYREYRRTSF